MAGVTDRATLRGMLKRLRKHELDELLRQWGGQVTSSESKHATVDRMLDDHLDEGATPEQVAEVDLAYIRARPTSKRWHALHIPQSSGQWARPEIDGTALASRITQEFSIYYHQHTLVRASGDALWLRIAADTPGATARQQQAAACYLVYHTRSPYVLWSSPRHEHKPYILHAVGAALGCSHVEEQNLSGKRIDALFQLVHGDSSSSLPEQSGVETGGPLERNKRKRPMKAADKQTAKPASQVLAEQLFGSGPLPALDHIEFQVHDPLFGQEDGDDNDASTSSVSYSVRFDGSNALEGFRSLVAAGIAKPPQSVKGLLTSKQNTLQIASMDEDHCLTLKHTEHNTALS
eukprot:jgi/Chlat1/6238/Chrsp44S05851